LDAIQLRFSPGSLVLLNAILGVVMFGVALDLKPEHFKQVLRRPRAFLGGITTQLVLLPALTLGLVLLLEPPPSMALGMMLVAACPGGNVSNFLVHYGKGNTALSIGMTAVSTAAAVIATPINLAFWASFTPGTRA
jgi:bile acid:Na+ symporter, BASS family